MDGQIALDLPGARVADIPQCGGPTSSTTGEGRLPCSALRLTLFCSVPQAFLEGQHFTKPSLPDAAAESKPTGHFYFDSCILSQWAQRGELCGEARGPSWGWTGRQDNWLKPLVLTPLQVQGWQQERVPAEKWGSVRLQEHGRGRGRKANTWEDRSSP